MSTFGFGGLGFFHVTSLMVEATASVHVLQYTFVTTKPKLLPAYGNLIEVLTNNKILRVNLLNLSRSKTSGLKRTSQVRHQE